MYQAVAVDQSPSIRVRRWPTERPLFLLNAIVAAGLWAAFIVISPQMLWWVFLIIFIIGLMHLGFITHVRGSAVRLGPDQFPELYSRVEELSRRIGLRRTPEVYLMQQDGAINAFATRFLRCHIVVLLADLLEACGGNRAARDMIIGHELGHIRSGHLFGHWLLMPAAFVPFLGAALSRAREYTCDRYGREAAGDEDGALLGLTILAAGGTYAPLVNRVAFVRQRAEMRRAWMLVGEWLGSHPPLSKRIAALAPPQEPLSAGAGWLRPAFAAVVVVLVGLVSLSMWLPSLRSGRAADASTLDPAARTAQARKDLDRLVALVEADVVNGRPVPWDVWELYERWEEIHPGTAGPVDPFTDYWYDYDQRGQAYRIWSAGPDGESRTRDDIVFDSRVGRQPEAEGRPGQYSGSLDGRQ